MSRAFVTLLLVLGILIAFGWSDQIIAQEDKGDLEDFADDFEEDSDDDDDDAAAFIIVAFIENFGDFARLWGGTEATAFGPYPSYPYEGEEGFMKTTSDYRSYYFNTEFSYQPIASNLRSYQLKWETQFAHANKLSFDFAVYQESLTTEFGRENDYLNLVGIRYGYALYRSPQMLLNLEGGFRGLYKNGSHGGPEIAVDLQLFPRRPLIIETEIAAAFLTRSWLFTVESSAGVAIGRFEVLGGMRLLKNGGGDLLDGFRLGLRVWY